MPFKPCDFPVFSHIDKDTVDKAVAKIIKYLGNISSVLKTDTASIIMSDDVLIDIIGRVERYRVYFHVFHEGSELDELNEGALLCYWIAKRCPFYHPEIKTSTLNVKIAVCLLTNTIYYYSRKTGQDKRISVRFIGDLYYSLIYRDISKESLMILANSFTGEG
jgi:hypothetical protein